ncbi:right-handed parallel beta-helix repeat-containing protein [Salinispora oceanensis]|uniref:right-handed parallel beta-helix repeat-containing protein n=1 Tax=Salinispora oceanensis TaxID=1050199 RepID=UPI0003632987|nr:right-handed parallel beta-helix repeat-containing protein [Salinispora oceanensis]
MSIDVTTPDGGNNADPPNRGRRTLWVAAGVVGLTGVVGLATLGGVAARDNETAENAGRAETQANIQQKVSDANPAETIPAEGGAVGDSQGQWGGGDSEGQGQWGGGDSEGQGQWGGDSSGRESDRKTADRAKAVPCNSDKLIQAIVHANQNRGGVLSLAKGCTYELTRGEHGNGLPVIKEPIVLNGYDTTIARAANAAHFRIFNVGHDGHLTLKGITVKGGQTTPRWAYSTPEALPSLDLSMTHEATQATEQAIAEPTITGTAVAPYGDGDGAGILVQRGGKADIEKSSIVLNHGRNGGGVANYGTTTIRDSAVEHNSATEFGGGVFSTGILRIERSKIEQNNARQGGGGFANGSFKPGAKGGTVWVWSSTISHNQTSGLAGGILDRSGNTSVTRSEVTDNTAGQDAGGMLGIDKSRLYLEQVKIERNVATNVAGGLAVANNSDAVLEESVLKENVAEGTGGAGLFNMKASVTLRKSEVVRNRAVGPFAVGGGIVNAYGQVSLIQSTVSENFATTPPGGIFTTNDGVKIDEKSAVKKNRPTNCTGSPVVPKRCFG